MEKIGKSRARGLQMVPLAKRYKKSSGVDLSVRNTIHFMAAANWVAHWEFKQAIRELMANTVDQSRTVADQFISQTAALEFTEAPGRFLIHIGADLLAEARLGRKKCRFVKGYQLAGISKVKAKPIETVYEEAQFIEFINYSSFLPFVSFNVGESSKKDNLAVIGKHGEGLTGACVVLAREGCNIVADCTHNSYQAEIVCIDDHVYFQLEERTKSRLPPDTVRIMVVFDPRKPAVDLQQLVSSVRLPSAAAAAGIATTRGTLLTDPSLCGKQFNRSTFISESVECLFGYDFVDPEKTLLQGRDRDYHHENGFIVECGRILSEAIVQNKAVCQKVLGALMYGPDYDPNGPGEEVPNKFNDLKDGKGLTPAAVDALRQEHESLFPGGQRVVFCTRDTAELNEIKRLTSLRSAYSLPVLHNHAAVIHDFQTTLVHDAVALDPSTRVGALQDQLLDLLKVRELKESVKALPDANVGIWVVGDVGYVTSVHALGEAGAVGLTEAQQISLNQTLRFARIPIANEVKIVRLLSLGLVPESAPTFVPTDEALTSHGAALAATGSSASSSARGGDKDPRGAQASANREAEFTLPPLEQLRVAPAAPSLSPTQQDRVARVVIREAGPNPTCGTAPAEETEYWEMDSSSSSESASEYEYESDSELESVDEATSAGDVHKSSDTSDSSEMESVSSDVPGDATEVTCTAVAVTEHPTMERKEQRDALHLPPSKRQKPNHLTNQGATSSSANTGVKIIDLSSDTSTDLSAGVCPPTPLLQDLPLQIALSNQHHSIVRQCRFLKRFGVWLYSDDPDAEPRMREAMEVCLPADGDRHRLRILSSLLHIVVFVTEDKHAPPAFNYGPHCVCINLGTCGSEQMFKYILRAQMQAVSLLG